MLTNDKGDNVAEASTNFDSTTFICETCLFQKTDLVETI